MYDSWKNSFRFMSRRAQTLNTFTQLFWYFPLNSFSVWSQTENMISIRVYFPVSSSSSFGVELLKTAGSTTNIYLIKSKSKQINDWRNLCLWLWEKVFLLPFHFVFLNSSWVRFADSESESGSHKSVRGKQSGPSDGKPTRVRTVLNEKQLHTLRWEVFF